MVSVLSAMGIVLFLCFKAHALERVVILSPAAADILYQLDAGELVVGVTNNVTEFPHAEKLGTHLNPGIEKIASLKPDLVICTSRFDPELIKRMGAEYFLYEPISLDEIIKDIVLLAEKIHKPHEGEKLSSYLQGILDDLKIPDKKISVLYETRSTPLGIAKTKTIIKDLLERAGMKFAYPKSTGIVSAEYILAYQPDLYIYQEGPMNKNPVPPQKRKGWDNFKSCIWKVDEFDFARPNTQAFKSLQDLNEILHSENPCEVGRLKYPE